MKLAVSIIGILGTFTLSSNAAIQIPGSDGSSGVLNITADTTIDLSLAATGTWDDPNTANGIYDASKWAVVFNYSSVNVDPGVTLTFTNHPSRAPLVWLVSGNVTVSGTVSQKQEVSHFLSINGVETSAAQSATTANGDNTFFMSINNVDE